MLLHFRLAAIGLALGTASFAMQSAARAQDVPGAVIYRPIADQPFVAAPLVKTPLWAAVTVPPTADVVVFQRRLARTTQPVIISTQPAVFAGGWAPTTQVLTTTAAPLAPGTIVVGGPPRPVRSSTTILRVRG